MFNIGSSLHEARTRQNLDLEEMERRTKVRAKYLRLLEDERFDQLPGHAYTKGFLHAYANALGLDGRLYVEEYNSRYVAGEDEPSPRLPRGPARSPRRRRERRETRTVGVALAAILVVTAFVIAAWRFGGHDEPQVDGVSPATRSSASTHSAQQRVTVTVRAVRGPSFMEVRAGRESGTPLYTGTLEKGQFQRFTKKRLFFVVERPQNVVVKIDGRRHVLDSSGRLNVSGATTVSG
ncbi:MAG TPA: helix-turn-helix domain-containing protein [Gaiella sp.]|nr:helix-turn-helix domain-containing protein [Gaiella sp.]